MSCKVCNSPKIVSKSRKICNKCNQLYSYWITRDTKKLICEKGDKKCPIDQCKYCKYRKIVDYLKNYDENEDKEKNTNHVSHQTDETTSSSNQSHSRVFKQNDRVFVLDTDGNFYPASIEAILTTRSRSYEKKNETSPKTDDKNANFFYQCIFLDHSNEKRKAQIKLNETRKILPINILKKHDPILIYDETKGNWSNGSYLNHYVTADEKYSCLVKPDKLNRELTCRLEQIALSKRNIDSYLERIGIDNEEEQKSNDSNDANSSASIRELKKSKRKMRKVETSPSLYDVEADHKEKYQYENDSNIEEPFTSRKTSLKNDSKPKSDWAVFPKKVIKLETSIRTVCYTTFCKYEEYYDLKSEKMIKKILSTNTIEEIKGEEKVIETLDSVPTKSEIHIDDKKTKKRKISSDLDESLSSNEPKRKISTRSSKNLSKEDKDLIILDNRKKTDEISSECESINLNSIKKTSKKTANQKNSNIKLESSPDNSNKENESNSFKSPAKVKTRAQKRTITEAKMSKIENKTYDLSCSSHGNSDKENESSLFLSSKTDKRETRSTSKRVSDDVLETETDSSILTAKKKTDKIIRSDSSNISMSDSNKENEEIILSINSSTPSFEIKQNKKKNNKMVNSSKEDEELSRSKSSILISKQIETTANETNLIRPRRIATKDMTELDSNTDIHILNKNSQKKVKNKTLEMLKSDSEDTASNSIESIDEDKSVGKAASKSLSPQNKITKKRTTEDIELCKKFNIKDSSVLLKKIDDVYKVLKNKGRGKIRNCD